VAHIARRAFFGVKAAAVLRNGGFEHRRTEIRRIAQVLRIGVIGQQGGSSFFISDVTSNRCRQATGRDRAEPGISIGRTDILFAVGSISGEETRLQEYRAGTSIMLASALE
jgi:hypothetical protein